MCECIPKLHKALEEQFGSIEMETKTVFDFKTNETQVALPPLYFKYHKKKADGTPEKKATRTFLIFPYCPFCGVRYKQEPKPTTPTQGAKV